MPAKERIRKHFTTTIVYVQDSNDPTKQKSKMEDECKHCHVTAVRNSIKGDRLNILRFQDLIEFN